MYRPRRHDLLALSASSGRSLKQVVEFIVQQCEGDIANAEMVSYTITRTMVLLFVAGEQTTAEV
jgi:hypothetical protein